MSCLERKRKLVKPSDVLEKLQGTSKHNPGGFFEEYTFMNDQGLRLHAYSAQPTGTKRGVVVMHHGIRAHSMFEFCVSNSPGSPHDQVKGGIVEAFVDAGFAFYCYDAQGHGLSEAARGVRIFYEEFDDLARDFLLFTRLARREEIRRTGSELPFFGAGISMGGGVAVKAAIKVPDFVQGLVLFCPMLSLEILASKPVNKILRPLAYPLGRCLPTVPLATPEENTMFPSVAEEFAKDDLCDRRDKICCRVGLETMLWTDFMTKGGGFAAVKTPFITFQSSADTYVDPASSERLGKEAQSDDKTWVKVDKMWHFLLVEPGREEMFPQVTKWVLDRI